MAAEPIPTTIDEALDVGAPFTDAEVEELFPTLEANPVPRPDLAQRREHYRIRSLADADWAGRKRRARQAKVDEIRKMVADQISRLKAYEVDATRGHLAAIEWADGLLVDYANAERNRSNGATKTVSTPAVKVAGPVKHPTVDIADEDAFAAWARKWAPDAVEDVVKLSKSKVPNVVIVENADGVLEVLAGGEVVPGLVAVLPEVGPKVRTVEIVTKDPDDPEATKRVTQFVSYTVKSVAVAPTEVEAPALRLVEDEDAE